MGEIKYLGEPPYRLLTAQPTTARGDSGAVELTVFASVAGKGPGDVPVTLGLSTSEARQLISDIQRAIEEAGTRRR
jgi:hypothetical protein